MDTEHGTDLWGGSSNISIHDETLGLIGFRDTRQARAVQAKAFRFQAIFFYPYLYDRIELSLGVWKVYNTQDLLHQSNCISLYCNLKEHNHISNFTIKQIRQSIPDE